MPLLAIAKISRRCDKIIAFLPTQRLSTQLQDSGLHDIDKFRSESLKMWHFFVMLDKEDFGYFALGYKVRVETIWSYVVSIVLTKFIYEGLDHDWFNLDFGHSGV